MKLLQWLLGGTRDACTPDKYAEIVARQRREAAAENALLEEWLNLKGRPKPSPENPNADLDHWAAWKKQRLAKMKKT